jgi:hypothetical protein
METKLRALHDDHHGPCDAPDDTYEEHCTQAKLIREAAALALEDAALLVGSMTYYEDLGWYHFSSSPADAIRRQAAALREKGGR